MSRFGCICDLVMFLGALYAFIVLRDDEHR